MKPHRVYSGAEWHAVRERAAAQRSEAQRLTRKRANVRPAAKLAREKYNKSPAGLRSRRYSAHRTTWSNWLARQYGLTVADFAWLLHGQKFACAICSKAFSTEPVCNGKQGTQVKANVDHNHKTGMVRGIVCGWCNYRFLGPLERGGRTRALNAMTYLGWLFPEPEVYAT